MSVIGVVYIAQCLVQKLIRNQSETYRVRNKLVTPLSPLEDGTRVSRMAGRRFTMEPKAWPWKDKDYGRVYLLFWAITWLSSPMYINPCEF